VTLLLNILTNFAALYIISSFEVSLTTATCNVT